MRALWSALREQVAEDVERLAFELGRQVVVAPRLAHEALCAGAVALQQQRAAERKPALGGERPRLAEIAAHDRRIEPLLPERRLGAAPQQSDARPARVLVDEGDVAGEIDAAAVVAVAVVAAQDRPFDQFARDRIADRALDLGGLRGLAMARQCEGFLDGGEVGGGGRYGRGLCEPHGRLRWLAWSRVHGFLAGGSNVGAAPRPRSRCWNTVCRIGLLGTDQQPRRRKAGQKSGRAPKAQDIVPVAVISNCYLIVIHLIILTKR